MVDEADKRHRQAVEKLRESYAFADWSHQEREKQLPDLTPEQRRQMNEFLSLMMEHEMSKYYPQQDKRGGGGSGKATTQSSSPEA